MADQTTLVAKFDGDVTGLQASTTKATALVDKFGKTTAATSSSVSKATNTIGLGFKALGGIIRSVTPFLGEAAQEFVMFGAMAVDGVKNAFDAVSKFAGFLKGGLYLGLAAAAAAVGYYAGRMLSGAAATEKALAAQERYNRVMRSSNEAVKAASTSWDLHVEELKRAEQAYLLFGDSAAYFAAKLETTKKAIIGNDTSITALIDKQADLEKQIVSNMQAQEKLNAAWARQVAAGRAGMIESRLHELALAKLQAAAANLSTAYGTNEAKIRALKEAEDALRASYTATTQSVEELAVAESNRKAAPPIMVGEAGITAALEAYNVLDARIDKSRAAMQGQMLDFVASLAPSIEAVGLQFANLWTSFSQGFGDAVGRAIVYGDDFAKAMQDLGKQLLSTLISFLIQTVINTLLYGVLATLIQGGLAAGRIALQASIASAAAYAAAIESFGLFGFALGPGLAAAAASGTAAAANVGFGIGKAGSAGLGGMAVAGIGMAEGGLVTGPTMALIGEKGDEAVIPLDRIRDLFGERGVTEVNIVLDDRLIAQAVVPWIPAVVHAKGVKGI